MRPEALKILQAGTVIPAFPLALHENRTFDERRQRALIRYYLAAGAGGLAAAVHTTQFAIRKPEIGLFEPVLRLCAEEIDRYEQKEGRTIVRVAGVCGPAAQACAEANLAKKLGYDAVLLSTGGLNELSEAQLIERAEAVAEIMPVIGFYLQPAVGGRRLSFDYWAKLCEIENVVAIKAAPFDRYMTLDVMRAAAMSSRADKIALYTGNDDNIIPDLLTEYRFPMPDGSVRTARFVGGLLGHWSMWTKSVADLFAALKAELATGSISPATLSLGIQVTDCNAAFFDAANRFAGCIPGVHEVLRRQGLLEGIWCLDEEETLSPGQLEEIDRVYKMYPHLNDDAFVREHLNEWLSEA